MKKYILMVLLIGIAIFIITLNQYNTEENRQIREYEQTFMNSIESSEIPRVIIETRDEIIREESVKAQLKIYNNNELYLESEIGIRIRGNSSSYYPKKQYGFTFLNGDVKESNKLFHMAKDSEWVLNAPFEDTSLIRNHLAYMISGYIMEYAPKTQYVEVYHVPEGEIVSESHYQGLYLLVEKPRRDKDKIDIFESNENSVETSFIVVKDRLKENDIEIVSYGRETYLYDTYVEVVYPKRSITDEQKGYIRDIITNFERNLYSDLYDTDLYGYHNFIDVDSFVDYYIINEFFNNLDAGTYSTLMYKDFGEKIKAGPVWDFNLAMGNDDGLSDYYDPTGFYMNQSSWFERLMLDRDFVNKVIRRYKTLRRTYLSDDLLIEIIDDTVKNLETSIDKNNQLWPVEVSNKAIFYTSYISELGSAEAVDIMLERRPDLLVSIENLPTTYTGEIEALKTFLLERGKWMDENIEQLLKWAE